LRDPISKKYITEKDWIVAQGEGPEFKPQYHTHTKKKVGREFRESKQRCQLLSEST
jgi:hypothetical protein